MAASTAPGLTPSEVAFLAEHELVEVIPRQRLEGLQLLGGPTPPLMPPRRASVPLWLALLLKRQQRANIAAPSWLTTNVLSRIHELEMQLGSTGGFTRSVASQSAGRANSSSLEPLVSGPFIPSSSLSADSIGGPSSSSNLGANSSTELDDEELRDVGSGIPGSALPYHWLEIAHLLLEGARDDIVEADAISRLIRDLREARAAKVRSGVFPALEGGKAVRVSGIGAMELAEHRAFVCRLVDGLRKIGASKETSRREREEEERAAGGGGDDSDDDEMDL